MEVDPLPAQPRLTGGVGGRSFQQGRPEPYSQSNGVLDDGDAADGYPSGGVSYSPPPGAIRWKELRSRQSSSAVVGWLLLPRSALPALPNLHEDLFVCVMFS